MNAGHAGTDDGAEPEAPAIELALDARALIGESPTWVADERALYWIDVKAPALHRFDPATGTDREWRLGSDIGAFALTGDGGAIVALRQGLHRLDLASGRAELLAPPPFDPALFRFNEGACDPQGRFWIGVMFDPLHGSPPPQAGLLYSYTRTGGLKREPDAAELHNGMAWSADGRRFYLSHSYARQIWAYDFDPVHGRLGARQLFAEVPEALGIPDGAALDTEGGYWCALHGGGMLRRYRADGRVDRDLALPVSQPTMCAFGGDRLDTLYLTSATDKLDDDARRREPEAGGIHRLSVGATGIPRRSVVA